MNLLVAGASSDVGVAIIKLVASNYETVFAHYNHWNDSLEELKNTYSNIKFVQADFSSEESIAKMIDDIKASGAGVDHIVHLPAPKAFNQKFPKTDISAWDAGYFTSVRSAVQICQAFVPAMAKQKSGKIVFMLTAYTIGEPPKFQTSYVTIKEALVGLMKSLASEYKDKGITVNGVSPDMIQTKFLSELPDLLVQQYAANRPDGKILTVDDVAPKFAYLLSDEANEITGQNVEIQ